MDNTILQLRKRLEKYTLAELGDTMWELVASENNFSRDIGKGVLDTYNTIQTSEEFKVAEKIFIAFTGEDMEGFLDYIDERKRGE